MFDVVVSGASYAGLALARALATGLGDGVRIGLLDRVALASAAAGSADPRATALAAASVRFLEAIGVWAGLEPDAGPVEAIEITDGRLESPVRSTLLRYDNRIDDGRPASWIVENSKLREALAAAVLATPAIERLPPAVAVRMTASPAAATIVLAGGGTIAARLVVAADGRSSTLRESCGIGTVGWPLRQTGIVAVIAHEQPHRRTAIQHFLPAGPFALLPLRDPRRSAIVWTEGTREAARLVALTDDEFVEQMEQRFGGRLGKLTLAGARATFALETRIARRFIAGRLALVGDAARVVHPLAGQGLNIGLRDVAALAEVVTDAVRLGLDPGQAEPLERYDRWRRFDSVSSAFAMDGLNRLFSNDSGPLRILRDIGLGALDRIPRLKQLLVAEAAGLTGDLPRLLRGERL